MIKTKKQYFLITVSWILVALCMAIIFAFSAQSGDASQTVSDDFTTFLGLPLSVVSFIRKTAHFFEFAGLAVLIYNALYQSSGSAKPLISFILTAVYAATDEFHQLFVEGRACRVFDLFVDSCGAATGIAALTLLILIYKKLRSTHLTKEGLL